MIVPTASLLGQQRDVVLLEVTKGKATCWTRTSPAHGFSEQDYITGLPGTLNTSCHCHIFEQFLPGVRCAGNMFVGLFYARYYFALPSVPLGLPPQFSPLCAVTWASGRSRGWQRPGWSLLLCLLSVLGAAETFDCLTRQQNLCWQPPGKVSWREMGDRQAGPPFFSAFSSGSGWFICRTGALWMQKEYIQHRAPWEWWVNNATIH